MKKRLSLAVAFITCISTLPIAAVRTEARPVNDAVRVERLAALCRLWGAVKFLHPYLAYKDIDWDGALLQAIPKVDAAASKEEYRAAVASMLAPLKDPDTRIVSRDDAPAARPGKPAAAVQPYIKWADEQTAVIVATDYNQFIGGRDKAELFRKVFDEAQKARAIIVDVCRDDSAGENFAAGYWFNNIFSQAFPSLIGEDFPASAMRYRLHSGYAPQSGMSSGGYFSALVTRDGSYITARGPKGSRKPIAFLVNAGSSDLFPLLGGLQSAGLATVIQEGDMAGGRLGLPVELADGLMAYVRTSELVNPDGSLGFQPDITVTASPESLEASPAMAAALKAVRENSTTKRKREPAPQVGTARLDKVYRETQYPDKEHRLLALFRFWNVIHYFFPYKHLMDKPWDAVLTEYIPKLEAAKDALEYHLTVAEMVTNIQDTHGFISSPVLSQYFGTHVPPIEVKFVEGQTVITRVSEEAVKQAPALSAGDVIVSVDGEEIAKRRERIGRYCAVSTPQALIYRVNGYMLRGAQNSQATLQVKGKDGKVFEAKLTRSAFGAGLKQGPVYTVLPEGYGYFDLTRLTGQELDAAFDAVKNTPALILDMRGYPRGIFFMLGTRLTGKRVTTALFERREIHAADFSENSRKKFEQVIEPSPKGRYAGKVAMLINEDAISQSEHTCLFVEAATDVTFIGSPTNGANGDVTSVGLPGGIFVSFTGHDVRHGDGRQLQRVGIQPHLKAEPTVAGIRSGKDEVLEKAIEFLKKGGKR